MTVVKNALPITTFGEAAISGAAKMVDNFGKCKTLSCHWNRPLYGRGRKFYSALAFGGV